MLTDIRSLVEHYYDIISAYPLWTALVCAAVHLAAVLLCVIENNRSSASDKQRVSRNTVHTVFWLCVLLAMPFAGIALYLLLSVLPYRLWKRSADENAGFPFTFRLRKNQLGALVIFGAAGVLLQFACELAGLRLSGMSLSFEAAFICWTITVLRDWDESLYKRAVFLSFRLTGEQPRLIPEQDIFGRKRYTDSSALTLAGELGKKLVRAAADEVFASGEPKGGTLPSSVGELRYDIFADQRQFEKRYVDTAEIRYLGGGISRYVIYDWSETAGELQCVERVIYRAAPQIRFFLIRSLILLFAAAVLFSPWYGVVSDLFLHLFF